MDELVLQNPDHQIQGSSLVTRHRGRPGTGGEGVSEEPEEGRTPRGLDALHRLRGRALVVPGGSSVPGGNSLPGERWRVVPLPAAGRALTSHLLLPAPLGHPLPISHPLSKRDLVRTVVCVLDQCI